MIGAIVTTATSTSLDRARGVVASARQHHPDRPAYVLTADRPVARDLDAVNIPVGELTAGLGLAVCETLGQEEQVVFGLPFLLERVVAEAGSLLFVGPGCLITGPAAGIEQRLARHPVVLTALGVPHHLHHATPQLLGLSLGQGQLSSRVFGLGRGAEPVLLDWQAIMRESFFDPAQRWPSEFVGRAFAAFASRDAATVSGEGTLMSWTGLAAIESGRAAGPRPAVVVADELWVAAQRQRAGDDVGAELQALADQVHDARPLARLVELIADCIAEHPAPAPGETAFDRFAREVRRSVDPTGARWGPDDHEPFLDWLYEVNSRGLTRVAHLYVASRDDLTRRFGRLDDRPEAIRRWNAERSMVELGADLLDRRAVTAPPAGAADRVATIVDKVRWRALTARSRMAGIRARSGPDDEPGPRGPLAAPRRVAVDTEPVVYGHPPRDLNLIGCFRSESGLGQAARASLSALRLLDRRFSIVDTTDEYPSRNAADPGLDRETIGAFGQVNLLHANAGDLLAFGPRVLRHRVAGRFTAAMWFWEPAQLPPSALPALDRVDELWLATEYLADVFGQYGKVPVKVVGLGVELPEARVVSREAFGLRDDELVFLFVFDAMSAHGRKNPEQVVEAFRRAFSPRYAGVRLVLKVANLNKYPAARARLEALTAGNPAITVIDRYFDREAVLDLMAAADVYVSLHAAEGFGLTLLEAMSLGTPVICTGYSGNMDFTTPANSWIVDYELTATGERVGPYPRGSVWASPRLESAVEYLRLAAADPDAVKAKAVRAMADARRAASLETYAKRLDQQLRRVL